MRTSTTNSLIDHLRTVLLPDCAALGDAVLLARFIERHDEAAFKVLVNRHGPMVWGVCRRLLHEHDAEDAFQATFLVLARKAASIRSKAMLGNWLYGVAHRTALRARRTAARRRAREIQVTNMPDLKSVGPDPWADIQPLLDEELSHLPDVYRVVIVLCDLEGRTRKEVACQLGVPEGTVASRVARARAMLAKRLTRRGVTLSGGALAAVLAQLRASAAVPKSVVLATFKAVGLFAVGKTAATGVVSVEVAALTEGVMKAMLFSKLKSALAVVLILGFIATGATFVSPRRAAGEEHKLELHVKAAPAAFHEWPVFRGDALNSGTTSATLPERLKVLWKFPTQDGVEGTAGIVAGTVYVGSLDGHLYAIDLKTGKQKWSLTTGPIKTAVGVHDGFVYVGDDDGGFHCVDAATGKERWKHAFDSAITSGVNFAGDRIMFGSENQTLHCLNKTGKEVWTFRVPGGPVMGTPAVSAGRSCVSGCDSHLHILRTDNGKEIATVPLGGQTGASVAVRDRMLYVGTMSNQVLAIDLAKRAITWRFESPRGQPFYASAAVTDNLVIAGSRDQIVYALDRKTGKQVWHFATGRKVESSPVVDGKRIFVGSSDGNLYVLSLEVGRPLQKFPLARRGEILASPAIAERCLVIGTRDGNGGAVYCLGR
jgi:RNA polymerase sigma factor (sigma-70 family)